MQLGILQTGEREGLKAAIHGAALCLVAVMAAYNAAAWVQRRKPHLAVNTVVYVALVMFEGRHVRHHRASLREAAAPAAMPAAAAAATRPPEASEPQQRAA